MITVFNADNYAQQWFFDKAFAELKSKGKLTEQEEKLGRFLNLDGYFAHMNDLIQINPNYVLIPSDENPFVIDANSRSISIPANFSKCAGVIGDDMCEIITFTVDRYFDYVDLATTNICIQWNTKSGKEGISHINLIDLETVPGKIRFGWPLTKELTAEAGQVTFAVRFFSAKENGSILYVLNTLKAAFPIKEGLNINENDEKVVIENNIVNLFNDFVQNSNNPSYPIPAPVFWTYPGIDLETTAKIGSDNTLTLRGQAIVSDNGHIVYNWYHKFGEAEYQKIEDGDERFTIAEEYVKIDPRPEARVSGEQYYKQVEEEGAENYVLITSKDLPDVDLYERITTLKIEDNAREDITGVYQIGARNYTGIDTVNIGDNGELINAINKTPETKSKECKILAPADLIIKENGDLVENVFLKDGKAELSVEVDAGAGSPTVTYNWYKNIEEKPEYVEDGNTYLPEGEKLADEKAKKIEINNEPGWYYTRINSQLNRQNKSIVSKVSRVINDPEKPQLVQIKYAKWTTEAMNLPSTEAINKYFDEEAIWNVVTKDNEMASNVAQKGEVLRLQADINLDNFASKLKSDNIKYQWYVIAPDEPARLITVEDSINNGLVFPGCPVDAHYLDVYCELNDVKYSYYCVITNELAGKTATFELNDYPDNVIFQIW